MRSSFPHIFTATLAMLALAGCSPEFNWRDYSSEAAPYRVMFPDKPSTHTRTIDLDGMKVDMTMTAAQVNGTMFAVGTAEAPDAQRAEAALGAMKSALIKNIGATIKNEKTGKASSASGSARERSAAIDIEATGLQKGEPMRLVGHFESRNKRFYQVVVMGKEKDLTRENVDMFMSSFTLQ
ncbi:hypothetical protein [Massilia sp. TSP1-1-2]|uniref:hypothetical protein n=1 Tax=Massilia sp. TSP1-1-2 TaxID=2804649 RepID=UPI003CF0B56F